MPARDQRRLRRFRGTGGATACCSSTSPTTWRTSGSTASSTTSRSTGATGRWPRSSTRASRLSARALRRFDRCSLDRRPGGFAVVSYPAGTPSTCQQGPGAALGRLVRQHPPVLDARLHCAARACPGAPACSTSSPTPPTTRTTTSRICPITPENDHDTDDEALARMHPASTSAPGLDFFDVFLRGARPAGAMCRACAGSRPRGLARVADVAAAGRARAAAVPGRRRTGPPRAPRAARCHARRRPPPAARSGCTIRRRSCRPPRRTRSRCCGSWPDEREIEGRDDVLTFTGDESSAPLDLAGPVTAQLAVESTCGSMHVHVKLLDVSPDGAARMLLRGQPLVGRADYGRPSRSTSATPAIACCRPPSAASRRLQRLPALPVAPGYGRGPLVGDDGAVNEQRLSDGRGSWVVST